VAGRDLVALDGAKALALVVGERLTGEVGIVGVAGAIANAVFNATGKRIRELPITPEKLL